MVEIAEAEARARLGSPSYCTWEMLTEALLNKFGSSAIYRVPPPNCPWFLSQEAGTNRDFEVEGGRRSIVVTRECWRFLTIPYAFCAFFELANIGFMDLPYLPENGWNVNIPIKA